MAEEKRQRNWLDQIVKIGAIVGGLSTVAFYVVPLVGIPQRVSALEQNQQAKADEQSTMLFMTCGLYRKFYPDQVPALCDRAISKGVK